MEKIEIKSINDDVLFSYEKENNTIKDTLIEAIRQDANLQGAELRGANLVGTNLQGAELRGANLQHADLRGADLVGANLQGANLRGANLYGADLQDANLRGAYLYGANLQGAELRGANLYGAGVYLNCPSEGSFIGWKKSKKGKIIKLLIPEGAKRSSATTQKCRCSKVEVLEIQEIDGTKSKKIKASSNKNGDFIYEVGKVIEVINYNNDRWNECSEGIHFFIDRQAAVDYIF